jgi:hypothetical protein
MRAELMDGVRAAVKDVIRVGTSGLRIGVVYKDTILGLGD